MGDSYSEGEDVLADSSGNVYVTGYTYGDFDGNKNLGLKISSLLNITLQEQSNGLNSMALPPILSLTISCLSTGLKLALIHQKF